jgi:hypothetical protein
MKSVTQWFEIDTDGNPVHKGIYECRYFKCKYVFRKYFDGDFWFHLEDGNVKLSEGNKSVFGNDNTYGESWRGLADKP